LSYKRATYISFLVCIATAIIFYIKTLEFPTTATGAHIGPKDFPQAILILIIIFSIIGFFTAKKQEDKKLVFENIGLIAFTIILTSLLTILWQSYWQIFGMFYLFLFIYLMIIIFVYNQSNNSLRKFLNTLGISILITLSVFIIFEKLLGLIFN